MITGITNQQVKVLDTPSANGRQVGVIGANTAITASAYSNGWLTLTAGGFVNELKSGVVAITWSEVAAPPPTTKKVTNTITVYADGSIDVIPA